MNKKNEQNPRFHSRKLQTWPPGRTGLYFTLHVPEAILIFTIKPEKEFQQKVGHLKIPRRSLGLISFKCFKIVSLKLISS